MQNKNSSQVEKKERTKCEVYSRVVGYLRHVDQWNVGKKHEFALRKTYSKLNKQTCCGI